MSARAAYEKRLRGTLAEWRAEIDALKAKAEKAEGRAQLAYREQIEELQARQEALGDKLDEIRDASDDAWEELKAEVDKTWRELGEAVSRAWSRID